MSFPSGDAGPGCDVSSARHGNAPARANRVRVLFACAGWPSGILEVASWAKHQDLAEPVIFQLQPGFAFRLDPEDRDYLAPGVVDSRLIESFARRRRPLSEDSRVQQTDRHTTEIRDARRGCTYRVVDTGGDLDVYVPENFDSEEFLAAIRQFARASGNPGELLAEDGTPTRPVHDAMVAVGGQFIQKLIDFKPHVVGFRLEGGDYQDVKRYIQAVRLFSNAEVVLGGPTATSHPTEVLEDSRADYVFAGEAEEPFNQFLLLAQKPNSKDRQPEIPGLAFRYGDRVYHNTLPRDGYERTVLDVDPRAAKRPLRCVRNAIRPVARVDLIAANRLDWSLLDNFAREFDSLFFTGGRGCPGACTFCARLHGQEVRVKSARQLLEEIQAADAKVAEGTIKVSRWDSFKYVTDPALKEKLVAWAAVYDEDFFLDRKRAIEFFSLWDRSPLKDRYRLGVQTNPRSLLDARGGADAELLRWIGRLKLMVQLGAESFNPVLLARWRKRHNVEQLDTVLDALDSLGQDYGVFILLTDFDTTPEELVETLRLLILAALARRRMRIASSPYTIPLFDSETRKLLEYRRLLTPAHSVGHVSCPTDGRVRHFSDYERPQPGWLDPLVAELADLADSELRWTLHLERRESALVQAFEVVLDRIRQEEQTIILDRKSTDARVSRIRHLYYQAQLAMDQLKDARFQGIGPFHPPNA